MIVDLNPGVMPPDIDSLTNVERDDRAFRISILVADEMMPRLLAGVDVSHVQLQAVGDRLEFVFRS